MSHVFESSFDKSETEIQNTFNDQNKVLEVLRNNKKFVKTVFWCIPYSNYI